MHAYFSLKTKQKNMNTPTTGPAMPLQWCQKHHTTIKRNMHCTCNARALAKLASIPKAFEQNYKQTNRESKLISKLDESVAWRIWEYDDFWETDGKLCIVIIPYIVGGISYFWIKWDHAISQDSNLENPQLAKLITIKYLAAMNQKA